MFKSVIPYRLSPKANMTADALESQLATMRLRDCGNQEPATAGWMERDGRFVTTIDGRHLIQMGVRQRLLPSKVVKQRAEELAEDMERAQGYAPGRKQRRELTERALQELLPKAFVVESSIRAWVDPAARLLCVEAGSQSKADAVIELMRKSMDELPLLPFSTNESPVTLMTRMMAGEDEAGFTVDRACQLRAQDEEKGTVSFSRCPLDRNTVREELSSGKVAIKLAMTWRDKISFVLSEKGEIKQIAILGLLMDKMEDGQNNAEECFAAEFVIVTSELASLLGDLSGAMGGFVEEEQ